MKKIAIITTHPIQYYAPLFRLLAQKETLNIKVFYTWGNVGTEKFDPGFGRTVSWDIPLLEGYDYTFLKNIAKKPGSSHFRGIQNPTIISEIETWGANAIFVFGWAYESHLKVLRHFKGRVPVYFRGDSTLLDETPGYKVFLRRLLLNWVYKHIDIAFYVGTNNKNYFLKHGLGKNNLIFASHAVDNKRFALNNGEYAYKASLWRTELGIRSTDKVIIYAGKLETKKNPLLLLQAFMELNINDAYLIFIGNGELEETLKTEAGNVENIRFIPFQNQSIMPIVYRIGDVFCLPSQGPGETWGLAINEAMASSRPVLVSDKCGCAIDLVQNSVNGYIFQSGNLIDLKLKMNAMLKNDNLNAMGNESFNMIYNIDIHDTAAAIEKALSDPKPLRN